MALNLTASSTAPGGTQNVTVSGTSGSQSASTTFPIQILQPTFSLTGYSGTSLSQGSTAAAEFFINSEYGFDGEVTFTVSSLPKGVTASFSPNPTTQQTTLTLSATSATVIGTYPLSVTGKSGSETSSVGFYLVIAAPTTTVQPSVRP